MKTRLWLWAGRFDAFPSRVSRIVWTRKKNNNLPYVSLSFGAKEIYGGYFSTPVQNAEISRFEIWFSIRDSIFDCFLFVLKSATDEDLLARCTQWWSLVRHWFRSYINKFISPLRNKKKSRTRCRAAGIYPGSLSCAPPNAPPPLFVFFLSSHNEDLPKVER